MILYTVGYEGRSIGEFVELLKSHGVEHLVDIRDAPISRKPGFAKAALSAALAAVSIRYSHVRALGCPKPIRARQKASPDWSGYTRDFKRYLAGQGDALAELRATAEKAPACLMCYEADFNRCHRLFVAEAITRPGDEIRHLPMLSPGS
jgi:uncharacterized protein (DUF488 family)